MLLLHHHRVVDLDLKCKRLLLLVLLRARVLAPASDSPTAPSDSTTPGTINDDLKKGTTAMKGKLPLFSCMLKGKLVHMRCAAHILNLIVKEGMSIMEKGIDIVRESVAFWSATPKRHKKFEKMAIQMKDKY
ncbi:hypothetical protein SEVIR_3G031051v4 [Setaria viridis]